MVEIECEKHVPANNKGNTIEPPAAFAQGQASVEIENDDCNRNSGNQNPGEGDGDQDPSYEEAETLPYTYLFEDNWPATGDYDMNDLVIGIEINNKKMGARRSLLKSSIRYMPPALQSKLGLVSNWMVFPLRRFLALSKDRRML